MMETVNAFDCCPIYGSEHFIFQLVAEEDAKDLLKCYTDPITLQQMNNDNCNGEFRCANIQIMKNAIASWQDMYKQREFIRWSIKQKKTGTIIGTIEIAPVPNITPFYQGCHIGILRIDVISFQASEENYLEIVKMVVENYFMDFNIDQIIMKAPSDNIAKRQALISLGFTPDKDKTFIFNDYYCCFSNCIK